MSVRLSYLIDDVHRGLRAAESSESLGDMTAAQRHYLAVAKDLYLIADIAEDENSKNLRLQQAEAMQERAEDCQRRKNKAKNQQAQESSVTTMPPSTTTNRPKYNNQHDDEEGNSQFQPVNAEDKLTFADVVGQQALVHEIRLRMIEPLLYPELAQQAEMKIGGGMLLYGPPGTGKTLMARAVAGEVDAAFYTVKASDLMNQFVGNTEKAIAALFAQARSHERAVLFFDEIEALVPKRKGQSSTVMARVVPQFLAEMDGFEKSKDNTLMIIGATNEPWAIDEAILRPGRFDVPIYVGLPDQEARKELLRRQFQSKPTIIDDYETLANDADGLSGADIKEVGFTVAQLVFQRLKENRNAQVSQTEISELLINQRRSVSQKQINEFIRWKNNSR